MADSYGGAYTGPPRQAGPGRGGGRPGDDASSGRAGRWRGGWRRGHILAVLAVLVALLLAFHGSVPNTVGNVGSLLETVLPWVGLAVPLLLVCALLRRSTLALVLLLAPVIVWVGMFGNLLLPGKGDSGPANLRVLTHNVDASNPDPAATARKVADAHADVVALEEVSSSAYSTYRKVLGSQYRYTEHRGTVALWSKYPIRETKRVNIKIGWTRALRARVDTPQGPVAVFAAHLASVRIGHSGFTAGQRDQTIRALAKEIRGEKLHRVLLMGDLNGTVSDRGLGPITGRLRSVQGAAGSGFGFSWPSGVPMARIDHVLTRGLTPVNSWVQPDTGSDHRPVEADLKVTRGGR